jgi:hypothetical protein
MRVLKRYLLMFRQGNITLRQLPHLLREWRLWLRITRNFSEIEGSWMRGTFHLMRLFQGYPEREESRKIRLPNHLKK